MLTIWSIRSTPHSALYQSLVFGCGFILTSLFVETLVGVLVIAAAKYSVLYCEEGGGAATR